MDIRRLTAELSVSPQMAAADLAAVAAAGFRSVICNRPDGEGSDQPSYEEIERAAGGHGLEARYLPAESGKVTDAQAAEFGRVMAMLPKPVLAFCRTSSVNAATNSSWMSSCTSRRVAAVQSWPAL